MATYLHLSLFLKYSFKFLNTDVTLGKFNYFTFYMNKTVLIMKKFDRAILMDFFIHHWWYTYHRLGCALLRQFIERYIVANKQHIAAIGDPLYIEINLKRDILIRFNLLVCPFVTGSNWSEWNRRLWVWRLDESGNERSSYRQTDRRRD